jgi:hypothetical protein
MMVRLASLVIVLAFSVTAMADQGATSATPAAEPAAGTKPAEAAAAAPKIDGKYRYVGGDKEQKVADDAIEKVVQQMLFIKRPIARSKLKTRTKKATSWTFTTASGKIKAVAEGIMTWESPADGSAAAVKTSQGDDAKLTQKVAGNHLTQLFITEDGSRENDFVLGEDGVTLTCSVTMKSTQLPEPVRFVETFKK